MEFTYARMYGRIDGLCKANGTNVTAMCRELGITRSVLSELKSGRTRQLSGTHLAVIAEYFDIGLESLIGSTGQIPDALIQIGRRISKLEEAEREQFCELLTELTNRTLELMKMNPK